MARTVLGSSHIAYTWKIEMLYLRKVKEFVQININESGAGFRTHVLSIILAIENRTNNKISQSVRKLQMLFDLKCDWILVNSSSVENTVSGK